MLNSKAPFQSLNPLGQPDLWKLAEFQQWSHEKLNARTGLTAGIDKNLGEYHRLKWQTSDFPAKYARLVAIAKNCMASVTNKGFAFRNGALALLAFQCLNVIRSQAVRDAD